MVDYARKQEIFAAPYQKFGFEVAFSNVYNIERRKEEGWKDTEVSVGDLRMMVRKVKK